MISKTFKNMKIAETISECKESTKESQGEVFEKVMISLPHLGNIGSVLVGRCWLMFGDLVKLFFKVLCVFFKVLHACAFFGVLRAFFRSFVTRTWYYWFKLEI